MNSVKTALILGLSLGALGVIVGVAISHFNHHGERTEPSSHKTENTIPVPPAQMPGLAYLPEGTDLVVALQLPPLVKSLAENETANVRSVLLGLGVPGDFITNLDQASGVGLNNVDQAVLGMNVKDGGVINPQCVLVIHTKDRFSIDALADRLSANPLTVDGRVLYRFRGNNRLSLELFFWAPNDRVLIAGLDTGCFKSIPVEGRQGLVHLSHNLSEIIQKQLPGDAPLWAVVDTEKWPDMSILGLLIRDPKQREFVANVNQFVSKVRTAALSLRVDGEPSVTAFVDAKSEAIGGQWRSELQQRFKNEHSHIEVGGAGNRLWMRTSGRVDEVRAAIEKLANAK